MNDKGSNEENNEMEKEKQKEQTLRNIFPLFFQSFESPQESEPTDHYSEPVYQRNDSLPHTNFNSENKPEAKGNENKPWSQMSNLERFDNTIGFSFDWEGDTINSKYDRGGETNYGITHYFLKQYADSVPGLPDTPYKLTKKQAYDIYRAHWNYNKFGLINSPKVALVINDYSINSSPFEVIKRTQELLRYIKPDIHVDKIVGKETIDAINACNPDTLAKKMIYDRYYHYREQVAKDSSQKHNYKGWINRLNSLIKELGYDFQFSTTY